MRAAKRDYRNRPAFFQSPQKIVLAAACLRKRVLDLEFEAVLILAKQLTIGLTATHPPSFHLDEQQAMLGMYDDEIRFAINFHATVIRLVP